MSVLGNGLRVASEDSGGSTCTVSIHPAVVSVWPSPLNAKLRVYCEVVERVNCVCMHACMRYSVYVCVYLRRGCGSMLAAAMRMKLTMGWLTTSSTWPSRAPRNVLRYTAIYSMCLCSVLLQSTVSRGQGVSGAGD